MAVLRRLTIKLEERALDAYKAYTMVDEVTQELQDLRDNPTVFGEWYEATESLAESVDQVITVPRVTGSGRQRRRTNYDAQDPKEYYL